MNSAERLVDEALWSVHAVAAGSGGVLPEVLGYNARESLTNIVRTLAGDLVLYVGTAADSDYFRDVQNILGQALPFPGTVLAVTDTQGGMIARITTKMKSLNRTFDLIVIDPAVPVADVVLWVKALPELASPRGVMHGGHHASAGLSAPVSAVAKAIGMGFMFGDIFWYALKGGFDVPTADRFQSSGNIEPIHFVEMSEALGVTTDRESFLNATASGISCRFRHGGDVPFVNKIPENYASVEEMSREIKFSCGYMPEGRSEGGYLSHLRNVTMSGTKGFLYSKSRAAYMESIISGAYAHEAHKHIIQNIDSNIKVCKFSLGEASINHYGAMFPHATHHFEDPVVVTFAWDLWCYNHWVSYTLSRLWYLDEFPELARLPIVIGPITKKFQRDYINMLGLSDANFIFYHPSTSLSFKTAFHSSIADSPSFTMGNINWLRKRFLGHAAAVPEGYESGLYFISRGDAGSRGIANEQKMLDVVAKYGFKKVEFGRFSVQEQIALVRNAKVIIGPNGSSMTNQIYITEGCCVLDLHISARASLQTPIGTATPELSFVTPNLGGHYFALTASDAVDPNNIQSEYIYDIDKFRVLVEQVMDICRR